MSNRDSIVFGIRMLLLFRRGAACKQPSLGAGQAD